MEEEILNIGEAQKIFNMIEILTQTIKDTKKEIKENLDKDELYQQILVKEEELKKEYKDRLEAIKIEKKAIIEEFKAKEELLYNRLKTLKIQLEGRKEALVQCLLNNFKSDKPTIIYKEKSNGKKNRVEISLNPKIKIIRGNFVSDEELLKEVKTNNN